MTFVDWEMYQACPVCPAGLGKPCLMKTGFNVVAGIEVFEEADAPHAGRKLRAAAARDAQAGRVTGRG